MISLLIWLIILCVIFGLLFWAVDMIPGGPPPLKWGLKVLLILILVLILLNALGGLGPPMHPMLLR